MRSETKEVNRLPLKKARVDLKKQHTTTKLELQAALIGARLAKFIKPQQQFIVAETYLWTDSSIVLQLVHGTDKRQQLFVANCVGEI